VNKVLYDFKFGKLSPIEQEHIKKTLIQKSSKNIDNGAVLLVNYKDWTKIKADFKESYVSESPFGVGRFKKRSYNHLEHCF